METSAEDGTGEDAAAASRLLRRSRLLARAEAVVKFVPL